MARKAIKTLDLLPAQPCTASANSALISSGSGCRGSEPWKRRARPGSQSVLVALAAHLPFTALGAQNAGSAHVWWLMGDPSAVDAKSMPNNSTGGLRPTGERIALTACPFHYRKFFLEVK